MKMENGNLIPEGLSRDDPRRVRSPEELTALINRLGFLPLFKTPLSGFSAEEYTVNGDWWTGTKNDPWVWREIIAGSHEVAYGKFFSGKSGFISKEWFPYFAAYRRNGYDFDSLYDDGFATRRQKLIMDVLERNHPLPSLTLKRQAGFGKNGESGFESAATKLQMQLYMVIYSFERKVNKKGVPYGMACTQYASATSLFSYEHITSQYQLEGSQAMDKIFQHMKRTYPDSPEKAIRKEIR